MFIYFFWLHWVFVAARGLYLVVASGGYSFLRCAGFSLRWLLLLRSTGSRRSGFNSCGSWAVERRLSSCGARAQLLRGMWDPPGPGLEPVSPCIGRRILNHCATKEAQKAICNKIIIYIPLHKCLGTPTLEDFLKQSLPVVTSRIG